MPIISHVSIGVSDLERAMAFYDAAMAPLEIVRVWHDPGKAAGYGVEGGPDEIALIAKSEADLAPGPGFHLALWAPNHDAVHEFWKAALQAGGSDLGEAGLRPQYGAHYYAAFALDPDGYKLEAKSR